MVVCVGCSCKIVVYDFFDIVRISVLCGFFLLVMVWVYEDCDLFVSG